MSFSSEAKNELCHVPLNRTCCARAEAYGVLLYCHTFDRREIRIITANDAFAQRLPKLFRRAFSLSFDHVPPEGAAGKRTFLITALVCRLAAALHPLAGLAVQMFWCAQALAAKGLAQESRNVYKELQKQDLPLLPAAGILGYRIHPLLLL